MVIRVVRDVGFGEWVAVPEGYEFVATVDDVRRYNDFEGTVGPALWVATEAATVWALLAGDFEVVSYACEAEVAAIATVIEG